MWDALCRRPPPFSGALCLAFDSVSSFSMSLEIKITWIALRIGLECVFWNLLSIWLAMTVYQFDQLRTQKSDAEFHRSVTWCTIYKYQFFSSMTTWWLRFSALFWEIVLSSPDMMKSQVDERSVAAYVACFYKRFAGSKHGTSLHRWRTCCSLNVFSSYVSCLGTKISH